jgi:hypothetical protein
MVQWKDQAHLWILMSWVRFPSCHMWLKERVTLFSRRSGLFISNCNPYWSNNDIVLITHCLSPRASTFYCNTCMITSYGSAGLNCYADQVVALQRSDSNCIVPKVYGTSILSQTNENSSSVLWLACLPMRWATRVRYSVAAHYPLTNWQIPLIWKPLPVRFHGGRVNLKIL